MSDAPTFVTARDEIYGALDAAWAAGAAAAAGTSGAPRIFWDGVGRPETPDPAEFWTEVVIRHVTGRQSTLADQDGRKRFEKRGIVTVAIYAPLIAANPVAKAAALALVAKAAFEGKRTAGGVWFRDARVNEVGAGRDGGWYHVNVVSDFLYEEYA